MVINVSPARLRCWASGGLVLRVNSLMIGEFEYWLRILVQQRNREEAGGRVGLKNDKLGEHPSTKKEATISR